MLGYAQKGGMADLRCGQAEAAVRLGADEMDYEPFADSFKVYIGHHGDKGRMRRT